MRYVALLRGIGPMNPNMRNEKLRGVVEALGGTDVTTVISSGNVVFDSPQRSVPRLEARLEAAWPERLGFRSTTIVRSARQVRDLVAGDPFGERADEPGARLNVTFLKRPPAAGLLEASPPPPDLGEVVAVTDGAVLTVMDETAGTPDLMRWLERTFGREISTRTWKTVHRIAARL